MILWVRSVSPPGFIHPRDLDHSTIDIQALSIVVAFGDWNIFRQREAAVNLNQTTTTTGIRVQHEPGCNCECSMVHETEVACDPLVHSCVSNLWIYFQNWMLVRRKIEVGNSEDKGGQASVGMDISRDDRQTSILPVSASQQSLRFIPTS